MSKTTKKFQPKDQPAPTTKDQGSYKTNTLKSKTQSAVQPQPKKTT